MDNYLAIDFLFEWLEEDLLEGSSKSSCPSNDLLGKHQQVVDFQQGLHKDVFC